MTEASLEPMVWQALLWLSSPSVHLKFQRRVSGKELGGQPTNFLLDWCTWKNSRSNELIPGVNSSAASLDLAQTDTLGEGLWVSLRVGPLPCKNSYCQSSPQTSLKGPLGSSGYFLEAQNGAVVPVAVSRGSW
jgi:hypothetical protein